MKISHKKSGTILGSDIKLAAGFFERLIGLMFVKEMRGMDGLFIENSNSIHNCFVRFPIDVVFLNRELKVIKIIRNFKPWRFSWIYWRASRVLELPVHTIPESMEAGDYLEVINV